MCPVDRARLAGTLDVGQHRRGGNESYPDVFQPFGGFADGIRVEDGYVGLPEVPGIGFEAKSALYRVMRELGEG